MQRGIAQGGLLDADAEALVSEYLAAHPRAQQKELRELLARERGLEIEADAFGRWARRKGLGEGYHGLSAFTTAQVEQVLADVDSPLDGRQRVYLAHRKGIGTEPSDQHEAARRAGLGAHSNARRFERIAVERLRSYFADTTPSAGRGGDAKRGAAAIRRDGPPLGVSSTAVADALAKARRVGMRLPERQERVLRGLWGVEGEAQLRQADLAREFGVYGRTIRDIGLRALAALRRAGHLSDPAAPEKERRSTALPKGWAGLLNEDLAALVEAFLCANGPWANAGRTLPNAEILRLAFGLGRPAHLQRPRLHEDVAPRLGFTSAVRFKRAYSNALTHLLRAAGIENAGPEEVPALLEEMAARELRRAYEAAGGVGAPNDPLPPGSGRSPNPLRGLNRGAVELALASPYGLLSRRERYLLGERGGVNLGAADEAPTQGQVAESMGIGQAFVGRLERRAAEKLRRLLSSALEEGEPYVRSGGG